MSSGSPKWSSDLLPLGLDHPRVQEVLALPQRGVFQTPLSMCSGDVEIVHDLHLACEFATSQEDLAWISVRSREGSVARINWQDMRIHVGLSEIPRDLYEERSGWQVESTIRDALEEIDVRFPAEREDLIFGAPCDIEEEVRADLLHVALSRALVGDGLRFYELVFAAYRGGGWPCGWVGTYPDGQLRVFSW